jgi:hypothetical protein
MKARNHKICFQLFLFMRHLSKVLLHSGETILIYSSQVSIEFSGQNDKQFQASKTGKLYLTTHRMVFNNKHKENPLQSFSFPFIALKDVQLEQPIFGANFMQGRVAAQPGCSCCLQKCCGRCPSPI